jgi:hypothetical protein
VGGSEKERGVSGMSEDKIDAVLKYLCRCMLTGTLLFVGMLIGAEEVPESIGYILLVVTVLIL